MAAARARARVLVVDDIAEIRELITRMLTADGHVVDAVATAEEAGALDPAGYDVLLIDAHLNQGSGAALIDSLVARDPGIVRRCVVITGGAAGPLPDGVRVLRKPFDHAALLELVHSGKAPGAEASEPSPAGQAPSGHGEPEQGDDDDDDREAGRAGARQPRVIELIDWLRRYDHGAISQLIHDGPAQDLSASILAIDLISRHVPADVERQLDEVATWLARTAGVLRDLTDQPWESSRAGLPLADVIRRQAAPALAEPIIVHATEKARPLEPAEQRAVTTVIDMLLHVGQPQRSARAEVASDERLIAITLTVRRDGPNETASAELAALDRLAWAFGGHADQGEDAGRWTAKVALRRRPSAAPW
ncbi:MAG TPA: response regulator [Streptosporangiaceae bacterium]|jgi:CheY-like chemotaxis protein|nr:response regulator [Streptosporangiaceae bacterium]